MIDYYFLNRAIQFFKNKGFEQEEVSWRVSEEAIYPTFNPKLAFKSEDKYLIGSAEQGFLDLMNKDGIKYPYMMAVSPCFRRDNIDKYHQEQFMKLELIYITNYRLDFNSLPFMRFMKIVINFLTDVLLIANDDIQIISTNEANSIFSQDIIINGVEYGSYGIRKHLDKYYIYGTGIALPRATIILDEIKGRR